VEGREEATGKDGNVMNGKKTETKVRKKHDKEN
jgi:hypothetical protein